MWMRAWIRKLRWPSPPMRNRKPSLGKRWAWWLWRQYRKDQAELHVLTYLFWECTLRCNLRCLHCGSDCVSAAATQDMPLGDFLRVLDEVATQYVPATVTVALTGGEPLLRPDLEACGTEFQKRGFPWGMVTNGYALSAERLRRLTGCGLGSVTVSLDGLASSHNWLRDNEESFSRAVAAMSEVARLPELTGDVVTCVNRRNLSELGEIKRLLIDRGIRRWRLFTIFPKGRAAGNPDLELDGRQLCDTLDFIRSTRQEGAIDACFSCEGFIAEYEGHVRDNLFWCHAGVDIGSVLADGSISACPSLRGDYIQGNIYRDSFLDCWNNRFQLMRDREWTRTGTCAQCAAYKSCQGNGLHLRDQATGELLRCHARLIEGAETF